MSVSTPISWLRFVCLKWNKTLVIMAKIEYVPIFYSLYMILYNQLILKSYLSSDLTVILDSVMFQRRSFIFLMIFACNCNIIFFNFLFYICVASLSVGPVRRGVVVVAEESPLWLYQPAAQEPREPHHDGPGRRLQGDQRVCGWVSSFILSRIRAFNPNSNSSFTGLQY